MDVEDFYCCHSKEVKKDIRIRGALAYFNYARECYGGTPLSVAAYKDHLKCMRYMMNAGADVNYQDDRGNTALMYAVYGGRYESAKLLLEAGAIVTFTNHDHHTALETSIMGGDIACVKLILTKLEPYYPITIIDSHEVRSTLSNDIEILTLLLNSGVKFDYNEVLLCTTSYYSCVDCMRLLLDAGADVDYKDQFGSTSLLMAARFGSKKCILALLKAGANINYSRPSDDKDALDIADMLGNMKCIKLLLRCGITSRCERRKTLSKSGMCVLKLHIASAFVPQAISDILEVLLDKVIYSESTL